MPRHCSLATGPGLMRPASNRNAMIVQRCLYKSRKGSGLNSVPAQWLLPSSTGVRKFVKSIDLVQQLFWAQLSTNFGASDGASWERQLNNTVILTA